MFTRTLRKHFKDLQDLSPWPNDSKIQIPNPQQVEPVKIRKVKSIPPQPKSISQRQQSPKSSIKIVDYSLPPLNSKAQRAKEKQSQTIEVVPAGRLIRNISSHRNLACQSYSTLQPEANSTRKLKLKGRRFEMVPQERSSRWGCEEYRPFNSASNTAMLVFSKNKDDVLRRVLNQIQTRINEMGTHF